MELESLNTEAKMCATKSIKYPKIRRDDNIVDKYFGIPIADPYRWLENTNSAEVKTFVNVQNQLTDEYLRKTNANRDGDGENVSGSGADSQVRERIRARLVDLWTFCDYGCPFKRGDHYFYFKDGALYMTKTLAQDNDDIQDDNEPKDDTHSLVEGRMILDPNSAADGFQNNNASSTTIGSFIGLSVSSKEKTGEYWGDRLISISDDGNVMAYGLSENGSCWTSIHFKNLSTGERYENDVLKHVRQDTYLSWTKDGEGLFYGKYQHKVLNYKNEKIFYHHLGTHQNQDRLIVEFNQNPNWELKSKVSDCGEYLIVYVLQDCGGHTQVYLCQMDEIREYLRSKAKNKTMPAFTPLVSDFKWDFDYITNVASTFYFLTNQEAPNFRVVKVDVAKKSFENKYWPSVVKHHKRDVLDWAICVHKTYLVTCYIQHVQSTLQLRRLKDGSILYNFPLDLGTVTLHCGRPQDPHFFFKFTSFLTPGIIYRVDLFSLDTRKATEKRKKKNIKCCVCPKPVDSKLELPLQIFRQSSLQGFDRDTFEVEQINYMSHDGTKVPMFLVHKKDLLKDGNNPCLLVGYGGFRTCLQPNFDPTYLTFIEQFNGIYAVANIRGGGEFGTAWYQDGIRLKKQNSFTDFQYAARYLSRTRYTSPEKLAIRGNSNGGLVVAACINQKPELFGAAIVGFGVLDLLKFHKFSSGSCWISDYGSSENESDFNNLLSISPLHNVKLPEKENVQYPATLLITSEHDEIVLPLHSYKMIAQLQTKIGSSEKQEYPLLLRVEKNAGHGEGGMTFETAMDEITDILTFIKLSLNLAFKD